MKNIKSKLELLEEEIEKDRKEFKVSEKELVKETSEDLKKDINKIEHQLEKD